MPLVQWGRGEPGSFWIRVLDRGFALTDRTVHPPLFSERTGLVRVWKVGKWVLRRIW